MKLNRFLVILGMTAGLVLTGCNKSNTKKLKFYTITWLNYDGEILEVDNRVIEGVTPHYDGAIPTRPDDGQYSYTFSGWTPELAPAHGNQEYTATYEANQMLFTIDFELNGGTSESYQGPVVVEAFTPDIFFFDVVREEYNFRGWSFKGEKIFDEKGNLLRNPVMERRMTFTAIFSQTVKLTILTNNTAGGSFTGAGEYPYNYDVDLTATENEGYDFAGWYFQGNLLSTRYEYKFRMWSDDVTIEARFFPESYILRLESNNDICGLVAINKDGEINNEFTHYGDEAEEYVEYTHQTTIVALTLSQDRFLGWFDEDDNLVDTNAVYRFVMPMNDYHLEARWNLFKIEYVMNGGTNNSNNPHYYHLEDDPLTLYTPTQAGKTFLGWKYNNEYVTEIDPSWMKNIELEAVWQTNKYTLTINKVNSGSGTAAIKEGQGYAGEPMKVEATPNGDSVFLGWFDGNRRLSKNNVYSFTMPATNYTITAQFQTKEMLGITMTLESNIYYYGQYPQSKITNSTTVDALNSLSESAKESNGGYVYNARYYYNDGDGNWFLFERIKWTRVTTIGNYYLLLAKDLLDCPAFSTTGYDRTVDGKIVHPSNYAYSNLRTFLNSGAFYSKAFALDSSKLSNYAVKNDASTTINSNNQFAGDNCTDKVFTLSYQDFIKSAYGFSSNSDRQCKTTAYAREMSASSIWDSNYNGAYWTRSSDNTGGGSYVSMIDASGSMSYTSATNFRFIRPAIYVNY